VDAGISTEYLTAKDLEAILQIDRKTIYGYVAAGIIPYVRIQSNLRFRKTEIEDWIERQSYRPRQQGNGAKERR
jgi:excisionase family DNA binding protein